MRHALRSLLRAPGFTLVAILTLALGIGLSTSSFSMANAFLLRNLPYPDADQLVRIFGTSPQSQTAGHAPANLIDVREGAQSFASFAFYNGDSFALGDPGEPAELVSGLSVTPEFFDVLGVQPSLGRGFTASDAVADQPDVAVLTHRSWLRRYVGDPQVIGRTIRINGEPYTVVGVLPPSFEAPLVWGPTEVLIPRPLPSGVRTNRRDTWMQAVARLRPDVSLRQAQAELSTLAASLRQAYPTENADRGLRVLDLHQSNMDGVTRNILWLMTGIALTMLLIACANLASLQVARALGRTREFAVRAALGGNRGQLMGPLLGESLLLAAAGGIGALLVAQWSNELIGRMLLINDQPGFNIPIDGRVLTFAAFSSILSGLAFGLAPAWISSRAPAAEALKDGSRGATGSRSHQRLKRALIVVELALALALVGLAASFGFGSRSHLHREVGWNLDGVFSGFIALPYNTYSDETRHRAFQRDLLTRLQALPGVTHAVLARNLPMISLGNTTALQVEGWAEEEAGRKPQADVAQVSPQYFDALQIPLRQGVLFTDALTENDPPVVVINESLAKRFWPGQDPIGRRLRLGESDTWCQVVAVVGDVQMVARFEHPLTTLQAYRPLIQAPARYLSVSLRTHQNPESMTQAVRETVAAIDPDLPVAGAGSLRATLERNMSNLNLVIVNLGISAGMGLLIAAVGLFGVISQLTAQRTRDIGVRIALGAQAKDVIGMILGEGLRLLAAGVLIGAPAYWGLTQVLRRAIPEMQLPGWWLLAVNLLVLTLTMMVACYLPARRATRISPVDALRAD